MAGCQSGKSLQKYSLQGWRGWINFVFALNKVENLDTIKTQPPKQRQEHNKKAHQGPFSYCRIIKLAV